MLVRMDRSWDAQRLDPTDETFAHIRGGRFAAGSQGAPLPRQDSTSFDDGGYALAYAYAHGAEGVTLLGGLELVHRGGDQAGAAGA